MDPIEILGSILGQKTSGSGKGAEILKEIFKGVTRGADRPTPQASSTQAPATRKPTSGASREEELELQARELEDLLNVAGNRGPQRTAESPRQAPPRQQSPQAAPAQPPRQPQAAPRQPDPAQRNQAPWEKSELPTTTAERQSAQALVLVRAMVNAAKSDGQISQAEQRGILERLDNPSQETIEFLREEFTRPLDVREFAWSVPVGMEQQVYTMSLIAIDVDSRSESDYLQELAHGLRLRPKPAPRSSSV